MSSHKKLAVITALLFVAAIATAVALTLAFAAPVLSPKLVWFAIVTAAFTGMLLGVLLTNLAYVYGG